MTQRFSCSIDTKKGPAFVTVVDNVVAITYSILESSTALRFARRSTSQATDYIGGPPKLTIECVGHNNQH